MIKRSILIAGILTIFTVLVVFNLLLLNQNRKLANQLKSIPAQQNTQPDLSSLWLTYGGCVPVPEFIVQEKGKTHKPVLTLLVYLGQGDCPSCLEEAEIWEKLYQKYRSKGLFVLGMVRAQDTLMAGQLFDSYGLTFPISPLDSVSQKLLWIAPATPFKVVIDSLRRVVYLSGPNSELGEQKHFNEVAEKLCRAYLLPG
jgi:hypothetical protein